MVMGSLKNFYSMLTPFGRVTVIGSILVFVFVGAFMLIPPIYGDGLCSYKETEINSVDCAVWYDSIGEIPFYDHYVTFRGVAANMQSSTIEMIKFYSMVRPTSVVPMISIIDETNGSILGAFNHITFIESGIFPNASMESLLEIECFLDVDIYQEPSQMVCTDIKINSILPIENISKYRSSSVELITDQSLEEYPEICFTSSSANLVCAHLITDEPISRDDIFTPTPADIDTSGLVREGLVTNRIENWSIEQIVYRTRYNDTHWLENEVLTNTSVINHKYLYADTEIREDYSYELIDEAWDYYGNFSFWEYKINDTSWTTFLPFGNRLYSLERDPVFENQESKPIIISGKGADAVDGYFIVRGVFLSELDGSLSFYNVVGNGICEEIESPSNSEDCI
jgi:hypothetical protein